MPNKNLILKKEMRAFYVLAYFLMLQPYLNLVKMQIPIMWLWDISVLRNNCLATVGVCVFRALASAGALFILRR